jgi:hypothetical protein
MGKTKVGAFWIVQMALTHPKTRWMVAARDSNQLEEATAFEIDAVLEDWLGLKENVHYKKVRRPKLKYSFFNKSEIIGVGAHNYDSVFRGPSLSGLLADEADYWKPDAWKAALGRVRVYPEFIRAVSSPKGYNHIWEHFYQNKSENRHVINATTYDNPTLSEDYIESLRASYSPRLFEQEVLGKRLRINVGAVYSEFDDNKHVEDLSDFTKKVIEDKMEIYFFLDYNIAHYCGVYLVNYQDKLYCIGEEHLQYKGTREMAQYVSARFPDNPIIVCGDSTGNNKKDVAIEKVNYQIFREYGLMTKNFKNPPVQSRIISANSNLYHKQVVIDQNCPTLIKDLSLVAWTEDGTAIEKTVDLSHASDAFTYGLWHFKPITLKRKSKTIQF